MNLKLSSNTANELIKLLISLSLILISNMGINNIAWLDTAQGVLGYPWYSFMTITAAIIISVLLFSSVIRLFLVTLILITIFRFILAHWYGLGLEVFGILLVIFFNKYFEA